MSIARKHHYVPQMYLSGFADPNGQCFVVDASTRNSFTTSPGNIAAERDFNRIDLEGVPPDALEKELGKFEGVIAPALQRVRTDGTFKDPSDREDVINLITLLVVRNPRKRENIDLLMGDLLQLMLDMSLESKERWEGQVAQMKKYGTWPKDAAADYEEYKKFANENKGALLVSKQFQIELELEHLARMYPYFDARRWRVLKAKDNTGGFVTTDHPVCLRRANELDRGEIFAPGYGMTNTEILFPLSSKIALIGRFDGEEDVIEAGLHGVASFNSTVIGYAMKQIYAANDQYYYTRPTTQPLGRGFTLLHDPNLKDREEG
jgi:hypothetical protein